LARRAADNPGDLVLAAFLDDSFDIIEVEVFFLLEAERRVPGRGAGTDGVFLYPR
jgi:hypothetical protein